MPFFSFPIEGGSYFWGESMGKKLITNIVFTFVFQATVVLLDFCDLQKTKKDRLI